MTMIVAAVPYTTVETMSIPHGNVIAIASSVTSE